MPRWERTRSGLRVGVADAADAAVAHGTRAGPSSKRVRNGVFSMEWISRWKPWSSLSWKIMPPHAASPDASGSPRRRTRPSPRRGATPLRRIRPLPAFRPACRLSFNEDISIRFHGTGGGELVDDSRFLHGWRRREADDGRCRARRMGGGQAALGRLVGWRLRPLDQSCLMEIFRMPGAEPRDTYRGEGDCATMVGRACCKEGGV